MQKFKDALREEQKRLEEIIAKAKKENEHMPEGLSLIHISTDCGISRMAFYYHFKDIYDLVEWACLEESRKACL